MCKFEIILYEKSNGVCPVDEFLGSLDVKMKAKMLRTIKFLETNGYNLREPHTKMLDDGIFELRAKVGSDLSRVLYFFVRGNRAVLTNGFIKKSSKTPNSEIELAKKFRADFLEREVDLND